MLMNEIEEVTELILLDRGEVTPPIDITKIVSDKGFRVFNISLSRIFSDELVSGVLISDENTDNPQKIIALEETLPLQKRRFVAAHEFGHYILHKEPHVEQFRTRNAGKRDETEEKEADAFARFILMPKFLVERELEKFNLSDKLGEGKISDILIGFVSATFNVTSNKAAERLIELGYVYN